MRICVSTVALNERRFVDRWCESGRDADLLVVGDTGSTDGTKEGLRENGAIVHDVSVRPWRFDHARNALLYSLPADIDVCVSLDMDEVLRPGWRDALEDAWQDGTTRLWYTYNWGQGVTFLQNKCHSRHRYSWRYPCHEHLHWEGAGDERVVQCPSMVIDHLPDNEKSRGSYLHLLRLGVEENPTNDRMSYYYGRELYFREQWKACEDEMARYLGLGSAKWDEERSQALLYMARCRSMLGDPTRAEVYLLKSLSECPKRRETWLEAAEMYLEWGLDDDSRWAARRGLSITERSRSFLSSDRAWDGTLERLATYVVT